MHGNYKQYLAFLLSRTYKAQRNKFIVTEAEAQETTLAA